MLENTQPAWLRYILVPQREAVKKVKHNYWKRQKNGILFNEKQVQNVQNRYQKAWTWETSKRY